MHYRCPESVENLKVKFRRLEGERTLVRSRFYFVARIDSFDFTGKGFDVSGSLLRPIEDDIECDVRYGDFHWKAAWEFLRGGYGVVWAPYASWSLYFDSDLISPVLEVLDADPKADEAAIRIISDWEAAREAKRSAES